jgi:DNA-binding transcriptional LysR family regulator
MNTACDIQEDSTIVGMVVQGLGAAILPRLAAEPIPQELSVYSLPVPVERVIGVAVLSEALHVPAVFAFLEMLKTFDLRSVALPA